MNAVQYNTLDNSAQQPAYSGDMLYTFTDSGITIVQELDELFLDMGNEA